MLMAPNNAWRADQLIAYSQYQAWFIYATNTVAGNYTGWEPAIQA